VQRLSIGSDKPVDIRAGDRCGRRVRKWDERHDIGGLEVGTPIGGHTCRKRPHQLNAGEEASSKLDGEGSADDS
jgi:hypothetical protein